MILLLLLLFGKPLLIFFEEEDCIKICKLIGNDHNKFFKKRLRELQALSLILLLVSFDKKVWVLLVMFIMYKRHIFFLRRRLKSYKRKLRIQFAIWLRNLEVLLAYNTVNRAIELSIESSPSLLKESLKGFVEKISFQPRSRSIFIGFLNEFEELYIEQTMHHLYQYSLVGSESSSLQLSTLIEDNAITLQTYRQSLFDSKLGFYGWFGLMPMLWVSMTFLGLMYIVLTHLMKGGWAS